MDLRRAILFHLLLVLAQPIYFGYQWKYNRTYFSTVSSSWLTVSFLSWLFILTRITIPVFKFPFRHVPSPPGDMFFLGHTWRMRDRQPPTQIAQACLETPNDGVLALWAIMHLRSTLVLTTPEATMEVVNTHSYDWEKPWLAKKFLARVLGEGLVNVEGNTHKAMRKAVAPAFSGRQIRDLVPLFWSKGLDFADAIAREARESEDGEVEMMAQMSRVTLDIIGSAGIGVDFNTIHGDDNRLAKLYETITSTNRGPILPWFLINSLVSPWLMRKMRGTRYGKVANANKELHEAIGELLAEKKRNMKQNSAGHKDIIATIMRSGDFPDSYLSSQLLTFLAAGHDTTASALTWTMHFLATNPSIQTRLRHECQTALSSLSPDEVTADTLDSLPYLTAVCNETLRFLPTVPVTARTAVTETTIGSLRVPRGTVAVVVPWVLNRHPTLWGDNADQYDPDRWLKGPLAANGGATNSYAFLTFLYGPRSCIGQGFARMEMKTLLAALVLRFQFEVSATQKKVDFGGFVTLKPKGGLKLRLVDLRE